MNNPIKLCVANSFCSFLLPIIYVIAERKALNVNHFCLFSAFRRVFGCIISYVVLFLNYLAYFNKTT